jgi:hypothetical protein
MGARKSISVESVDRTDGMNHVFKWSVRPLVEEYGIALTLAEQVDRRVFRWPR